ncbi:MAG: amine dehydrogenase [Gammaproteobacteria bacterium]|nr:amine dehydrogenase [Gammaproteobacteria bacterium]
MVKRSIIALCALAAGMAHAEIAPEKLTARKLPANPGAHWVWVNDMALFSIDGKAFLVDADKGEMLGMISGGAFHDALVLAPGYRSFYSTDTFFARGTRGERTDVVTIYEPTELTPVGEVVIPPKQLLSVATPVASQVSDDGRFVLVYNFTPAQSVSVVDTQARTFAGEIETPGCGMVYAAGPRRFLMMCANGTMLVVKLDDQGKLVSKKETEPLFAPAQDLLNEDAVRVGDKWYFISYKGDVYAVDVAAEAPRFEKPWPVQQGAERDQWRPGGYQLIAAHAASARLYVAMHRGGAGSHKQPAEEIWVHDLAGGERVARFPVEPHATSIQVSRDGAPLLYTVNAEHPGLEIYDATSGRHLRSVPGLGLTPSVLQVP